jgi:hypothetical protein
MCIALQRSSWNLQTHFGNRNQSKQTCNPRQLKTKQQCASPYGGYRLGVLEDSQNTAISYHSPIVRLSLDPAQNSFTKITGLEKIRLKTEGVEQNQIQHRHRTHIALTGHVLLQNIEL